MNVKQDSRTLVEKHTSVIQRAIALGDKHGGYYRVTHHIGRVTQPVVINGWTFIPQHQDDSQMPKHARFHLNLMLSHFRVDQVLIAHEPEPERKKIEIPKLPSIRTEPLIKVASVLGNILAAGVMVVGYAALTALTLVDPALFITFEGEEDWMLCVATW